MFETLAQVAVFATILGVFLTVAAWLNGRRTTKEVREIISELTWRMEEGFRIFGQKMDDGFKTFGQKMDDGFKTLGQKMDDGFKTFGQKMDDGFKMLGKRMDEGFKLIARLISTESDRTRKEILEALGKGGGSE
jgi:hypothetical protein